MSGRKAGFQNMDIECFRSVHKKSLVRHLASSSSIDSKMIKNLWKYRCPRRDNIVIWVMIFGPLNCAKILPRETAK